MEGTLLPALHLAVKRVTALPLADQARFIDCFCGNALGNSHFRHVDRVTALTAN